MVQSNGERPLLRPPGSLRFHRHVPRAPRSVRAEFGVGFGGGDVAGAFVQAAGALQLLQDGPRTRRVGRQVRLLEGRKGFLESRCGSN